MYSSFLGIDISKLTFDVALLINGKIKTKKFSNNPRGFLELTKWLQAKEVSHIHICMEATGGYEKKLAEYLYDNKIRISIVNPARIKGFAISKLSRGKSRKVVVIAVMRKLLHIIFGVLKSKTCFNPDIAKLNDKIIEKAIAI